jgi:hypothetical protein
VKEGRLARTFPLQRLKPRSCAHGMSPPRKLPLVKILYAQVLYAKQYRLFGFAHPAMTSAVSGAPRGIPVPPFPIDYCNGFILTRCESPSEFSEPRPANDLPCGSSPAYLSWGFFPLRGVSSQCPLPDGSLALPAETTDVPGPLCSALDVSHAFDGFLHHEHCEFVSPRNHVQDSSSGSLSLDQPHELVARRFPRDVHRPLPAVLFRTKRRELTSAYRALLQSRTRFRNAGG